MLLPRFVGMLQAYLPTRSLHGSLQATWESSLLLIHCPDIRSAPCSHYTLTLALQGRGKHWLRLSSLHTISRLCIPLATFSCAGFQRAVGFIVPECSDTWTAALLSFGIQSTASSWSIWIFLHCATKPDCQNCSFLTCHSSLTYLMEPGLVSASGASGFSVACENRGDKETEKGTVHFTV